jgi:hypothetical protein
MARRKKGGLGLSAFGGVPYAAGGSVQEAPDMTSMFNTQLSPSDEAAYQAWANSTGKGGDTYDYDLRGAWKDSAQAASNGHLPDTWKKPNHPTFSTGSQYSTGDTIGGSWQQDRYDTLGGPGQVAPWSFDASPTNVQMQGAQGLRDYFNQREPDSILAGPGLAAGGNVGLGRKIVNGVQHFDDGGGDSTPHQATAAEIADVAFRQQHGDANGAENFQNGPDVALANRLAAYRAYVDPSVAGSSNFQNIFGTADNGFKSSTRASGGSYGQDVYDNYDFSSIPNDPNWTKLANGKYAPNNQFYGQESQRVVNNQKWAADHYRPTDFFSSAMRGYGTITPALPVLTVAAGGLAAGLGAAGAVGASQLAAGTAADLTEPIAGLSSAAFSQAGDAVANGAGLAAGAGTFTGSQAGDWLAKQGIQQGLKFGQNVINDATSAAPGALSGTITTPGAGAAASGLGGTSAGIGGNGAGLNALGLAALLPGATAPMTAQQTQQKQTTADPTKPAYNPLDPANLAVPDLVASYNRLSQMPGGLNDKNKDDDMPQGLAGGGVADAGKSGHSKYARGSGLIRGSSPGRSDSIPTSLPRQGFVMPADVVSGLGEGNTDAGGKHFRTMIANAHKGKATPHFSHGGVVPARVSAGEFFIHPAHVAVIGGGDIAHGHEVLREVVNHVRQKVARHAATAPEPAR